MTTKHITIANIFSTDFYSVDSNLCNVANRQRSSWKFVECQMIMLLSFRSYSMIGWTNNLITTWGHDIRHALQFFLFCWNATLQVLNKMSSRNIIFTKIQNGELTPGGDEVTCRPPKDSTKQLYANMHTHTHVFIYSSTWVRVHACGCVYAYDILPALQWISYFKLIVVFLIKKLPPCNTCYIELVSCDCVYTCWHTIVWYCLYQQKYHSILNTSKMHCINMLSSLWVAL